MSFQEFNSLVKNIRRQSLKYRGNFFRTQRNVFQIKAEDMIKLFWEKSSEWTFGDTRIFFLFGAMQHAPSHQPETFFHFTTQQLKSNFSHFQILEQPPDNSKTIEYCKWKLYFTIPRRNLNFKNTNLLLKNAILSGDTTKKKTRFFLTWDRISLTFVPGTV